MNQTARIISIYAADVSGVCSALYELGGMTVIHDASGCNSTYTTHDEPRWYDKESMVYISGLTERDAVMGNDEKLISDLCRTAEQLSPKFIAVCGSPMPAMTGVDLEAIACETEDRTGIPSFCVKTNGMHSYIRGAERALCEISKRFTEDKKALRRGGAIRVNVLGITPLDFYEGSTSRIREWLTEAGFEVNAVIAADCSLDDVVRLAQGDVSLAVSSCGRMLAEQLRARYGIQFVVGAPYGKRFCKRLAEALWLAASEGCTLEPALDNRKLGGDIAIVGESVLSASLACALALDAGVSARVLESVGEGDMSQLSGRDISCDDEDELERELTGSDIVIADPLFRPICGDKRFIPVVHEGFSGRCFRGQEISLINRDVSGLLL